MTSSSDPAVCTGTVPEPATAADLVVPDVWPADLPPGIPDPGSVSDDAGSDVAGHAHRGAQRRPLDGEAAAQGTDAGGRLLGPGSTVAGRYLLERLLGVGARKRVHLGHDLHLQRPVAVCTLRPDERSPAEVDRLRAEAALLARLGDHPRVVTVHDLCEDDGAPVVVCQYLPGGSLEERLADGVVPVDQALALAADVAGALEHAHAVGVVHRDVKPGNVWLDRDGRAVLGDFGLAVSTGQPDEAASVLVGTAAYMAPEQVVGQPAVPASDVYALGALLYELLCGRPPFVGTDVVDVLRQVLHDRPAPPSSLCADLPAGVDDLVLRMLATAAADRPSATVVVEALEALRRPQAPASAAGDDAPGGSEAEPLSAAEARPGVAGHTGSGFVGREDELEQLRSALREAAAGRGGLTVLLGEAGMGKTRTALELAGEAAAAGWSVLPGRCHEGDGAPAFWPWTQALRAAVREHGVDRVRELAGRSAPLLAGLLPDLGPSADQPAGPLDADARQFQVFDAVATLLRELAGERPVLVVLDDVHWADPASLALAVFVARQLADSAIAVLACGRGRADTDPASVPAFDRLSAAARRTVHLGGLPAEQAAVLVEAALGVRPDAALVSALHEQTDGNPFFLGELVRLLAAENRLGADGTLLPGEPLVPEGVRDVLHRRLQHVSPRCAELLRAASVLGREVRLDVLCAVAEVGADDARGLLEEALRARLVVPLRAVPPRYRFAHALVQEALYEEVPAVERAELHRRTGRTLAALHAGDDRVPAAEVAHHFVRGMPGEDLPAAVTWSLRAGRAASSSAAHEDAVAHVARAVLLAESAVAAGEPYPGPPVPSYGELLLVLGDAQCRAGDTQAGRGSFQRAAGEALLRDDPELLARAALGYGVGLGGFGFVEHADGELLSLLEEALATLPPGDSSLRVQLMSRLATELYFTPFRRRRLELSEQAVAMAGRLGDPVDELVALYGRTLALLGPDGVEERARAAGRVVRLATVVGDHDMAFRGHCMRVAAAMELGAREQAEADVAACHRIADAHGHPVHRWQTAAMEAMLTLLSGDFAAAQERADRALELGRRGHGDMAGVMHGAQSLGVAWGLGRMADLVDGVRAFADMYPYAPAWRAALAYSLLELDRVDEAAAELAVVAERDFAGVPRDGNFLTALALLAPVVAATGDVRRAELLERALTPYADRTVVMAAGALTFTSVELALGVLRAAQGDADGALEHLARAQERHDRAGARGHVVVTAREQVRVLLQRGAPGDAEAAGALLATALPLARELGMVGHVEQLLRSAAGLVGGGGSPGESLHAMANSMRQARPDAVDDAGAGAPVTVLLTDLAGSTELTERLGERAVHALLVEHRRRVERAAQQHGGLVVKSLGDGLLLAFADAAEALRCAYEVQEAHRDVDGVPVRLRMAVHTGRVLREGDSMYGRTMIVAFRLADRARAGDILVSADTRSAVEHVDGLAFDGGRRLRLKGFEDRLQAFRLLPPEPGC